MLAHTNIINVHVLCPKLSLLHHTDNSDEVKVIILSGPMIEDGELDEDQFQGLPPFFDKIFQSFFPSFDPPPNPTKTSVKVHYAKKHSRVPCGPETDPTDCKSRSERVDENSEMAEMMTNLQNIAEKIFQNFFQSFFESEQENIIDVENATALDDRVLGDSNGTEVVFHGKHETIDINHKTGNMTNNNNKTVNGTGKINNSSDKTGNGTGNSTLVEKQSQGKEKNVSQSNAHDKEILEKKEKMPAKSQLQDNDAKGGIGLEALQANVIELLNSVPLQPEAEPHNE